MTLFLLGLFAGLCVGTGDMGWSLDTAASLAGGGMVLHGIRRLLA